MTDTTTSPAERSTYRHGDLRRALLEAGIQLARAGGPDAIVLREATRRAGVAGPASPAAIRAGYSAKTAREIGHQNLTKLHIASAIVEYPRPPRGPTFSQCLAV